MTILHHDGMDAYNIRSDLLMLYTAANMGISTTGSAFGTGCLTHGDLQLSGPAYQSVLSYTFASPTNDSWSSFRMTCGSTANQDLTVASLGSNSGTECVITYNASTGVWTAWRGQQSANLGSATKALTSGWHWIDVRFKFDGSTGIIEVWVDEMRIINLTGQNTVAHTGTTGIVVTAMGDLGQSTALQMSLDDWFIYDSGTTRLGDSRIETCLPNSDATPNNATPSTGTVHYAMVNEAQWNTSNYLTMPNTSGDKEVFGVTSILGTPPTVYSVRVYMISEKSDAGSFQLEPIVVSGGTEGDGSAQQLTTSWTIQSAMFLTDPHTGSAWTYAAANAMDIGYKVP